MLSVSTANACMMIQHKADADALKAHDVVFLGTFTGCSDTENGMFYRYDVKSVWKGELQRQRTVFYKGKKCNLDFLREHEILEGDFLIFANKIEKSPHVKTKEAKLCTWGPSLQIVPFSRWGWLKEGISTSWRLFRMGAYEMIPEIWVWEKPKPHLLGEPIHTFPTKSKKG